MTTSDGGRAEPIQIWVLPVGDADAIVLRFPDGTWGIVDSFYIPGTKTAAALPLLHGRMLSANEKIGFVCLTHYHDDHFSGLSQILYEGTPLCASRGHFYHSGFDWSQRYEEIGWRGIAEVGAVRAAMEDATTPPFSDWGVIRAGARASARICPRITAHFIAPTSDIEGSFKRTLFRASRKRRRAPLAFNRIGIAFVLKYGKAILLFSDDIEEPMWRRIRERWPKRWPKPCWVKVSHHGGRSGNPEYLWPWLAAGTKKKRKIHVVISADGCDHPDRDVLAEVKRHAQVHATWTSRPPGPAKRAPVATARTRTSTSPRSPVGCSPLTTWRAAYPDGRVCKFEIYPNGRVVPR